MTPRPSPTSRVALLCATFVWVGMATTVLGPAVPILMREHALEAREAGLLFTAQFIASMVTAIGSTAFARRWGAPPVMAVGYVCSATGIVTLGVLAWPGPIVASAFNGTGLGLVIPLTNLLVSRPPSPEASARQEPTSIAGPPRPRASRDLAILNFAWGIGSVIWPGTIAIHASLGRVGLLEPSLFVALGLIGSAAGVFKLGRESDKMAAPRGTSPATRFSESGIVAALMVYGVLQLLYVGTENAIGGWVGEHVRRIDPVSQLWIAAPTTFWTSLMVGRLLGPLVLRVVSDSTAITACLGMILVASTTIVASGHVGVTFVAIAVAGLGCSLVFPVLVAATTADLDRRAPALVGAAFACGSAGGGVIPWLVGLTATTFGSLTAGLLVPVVTCALMIAMLPLYRGQILILARSSSADDTS